MTDTTPIVSVRDLEKSYGGIKALKGVTFDVHRGQVHALMGENGAGKSTALGVIAGRIERTAGELVVDGEARAHWDPRVAAGNGVASIYQELTVVPDLSPAANVFLGRPLVRAGFLRERAMRNEYLAACRRLGVNAARTRTAGELSVAEQQMIEIVRALVLRPRVILFDEPTASLAEAERAAFHRLVRQLRDEGLAIVLVSHNLDEVLDLADHITVFRDGRLIESRTASTWDRSKLVAAMLGGESAAQEHDLAAERRKTFAPSLPTAVPRLKAAGLLGGVDLEVHSGEILGVAGLVGSGRTSLLRSLLGADRGGSGRLWIDGVERPLPRHPRQARRLGISFIPEDRKHQGLFMGRSAADNIVMAGLRKFARLGLVLTGADVRRGAREPAQRAAFDGSRLGAPAGTLSGGNQQKLLFARWLGSPPAILLVDEPTRGVDVGAKAEILAMLLRTVRESGMSAIVVSSELDELITISDRIMVIARGRKVDEFSQTTQDVTQDQVLHASFTVGEVR